MIWSNPIVYPQSVEQGRGFRDPFFLKEGDCWYLTGTMYPHFEGDKGARERTRGVPLYRTRDFVHWELIDIILKRPDPSEGKWYQNYFWAPELFLYNGRYYLTVSCSRRGHYEKDAGVDGLQAVCLAVADRIEGPYQVLTEKEPLLIGNDAHLFRDEDGRVYLFASGIICAEIDLEHARLTGRPQQIVTPVAGSRAWNGQRDGVGFEGPYVIKRNGKYLLFYSTWARGYEIGIAESSADSPLTGWRLQKAPFYGAMNRESCRHYGAEYEEGYYAYNYREAGHNSVFLGPDGGDWIAAHVFEHGDGDDRIKLAIDRLQYEEGTACVRDQNGKLVNGPTHGRQFIDSSHPPCAAACKALDTWAWCRIGESYKPPEKTELLFENGWRKSCGVSWEGAADLSREGTSVINGSVFYEGTEYPCKLTVSVQKELPNRKETMQL